MKKILIIPVIAFLALAPLACNRLSPSPVSPLPPPITTPICAMTPLSSFYSELTATYTPAPLPTATSTPTPEGPSFSPTPTPTGGVSSVAPSYPLSTSSVSYPNSPFSGTVLRSTADWQALYKTDPPPDLDFSKYMVLVQSFPGCCWGTAGFANVCLTSTEVEVSLFYQPWTGPDVCYAVCNTSQAVIVPKSDLPIIVTTVETFPITNY